jgi:hypothetical protein
VRGQTVLYRYPVKLDPTIHSEMLTELSEPIEMDIIFIENPRTATLKKIKWVSEFPNDKPYIAILPYDAPNLCTECVISVRPVDNLNETYRDFKITSINTILEYPDSWTCTLAPIFDIKSGTPKNDYSKSNYNYIDGSNSTADPIDKPEPEPCDCKEGECKILGGYSYIKPKGKA